jgi:hypothetical protein
MSWKECHDSVHKHTARFKSSPKNRRTKATISAIREVLREVLAVNNPRTVTEEQISALGLPTHPTKKTDSRARSFHGKSVEVDAIPPDILRELVRQGIPQHIAPEEPACLEEIERGEKETLGRMRVLEPAS